MLTGPGIYQPSRTKKLGALNMYQQRLGNILSAKANDTESQNMLPSWLWHNDLHGENISVNSNYHTQITAIIDWRSTQVFPLFDHHMDPVFLDYQGPDIGENLEQPAPFDAFGMSESEEEAAFERHVTPVLMTAWRCVKGRSPTQYG